MTNTVAIVGGDKRYLFAAEAFADSGYEVKLFGFSRLYSCGNLNVECNIEEICQCDAVVFPVPPIKEENIINTPFAKKELLFDDHFFELICDKKIFCPMKEQLIALNQNLKNKKVFDYFKREEFTLLNAYLTCEGALQTALNSYEGSIFESKILVCGFGRIGKCLAKILRDLKADVYVSARKPEDFAKIKINGYKALNTENFVKFVALILCLILYLL